MFLSGNWLELSSIRKTANTTNGATYGPKTACGSLCLFSLKGLDKAQGYIVHSLSGQVLAAREAALLREAVLPGEALLPSDLWQYREGERC